MSGGFDGGSKTGGEGIGAGEAGTPPPERRGGMPGIGGVMGRATFVGGLMSSGGGGTFPGGALVLEDPGGVVVA